MIVSIEMASDVTLDEFGYFVSELHKFMKSDGIKPLIKDVRVDMLGKGGLL
jgi:hypothetical protein